VVLDPGEIAALAAAAFAGSVVFGITGFGAALVTVPLATHFVPLPFALALFVLMDLANAFRIGFENPKHAVKSEWTRLVPTILVGTVAGVTLLASSAETRRIVSTHWAYLAGFAGGITSALFGAGGPPYAMYLSHRGLAKEQYRATMGFATLTSISLRTIAFFATGILLDVKVWTYAVAIIPAGLAGLWAAGHLFRRISRDTLLRVVALMLLVSGASLVLRALS
jgi:uncharacterized membrane protein YfcA